MKWAGVGSRDKGNTLKVKRLCIWTRFLDKLKGSQNIAMLDLFTLVRNPLVAKKKKKSQQFWTSLQHCKIKTFITHSSKLREPSYRIKWPAHDFTEHAWRSWHSGRAA